MLFLLSTITVILAWKFGDWKNWRAYYPTYLYFVIGDLTYNVIFWNHRLWTYTAGFQAMINNHLLVMWTIYPATVLLFLPNWPDKPLMGVRRIFIWVFFYTAVEWIFVRLGQFSYEHGWNLYYSVMFSLVMFFMLRLHYTHPLLTWFISLAIFMVTQTILIYS